MPKKTKTDTRPISPLATDPVATTESNSAVAESSAPLKAPAARRAKAPRNHRELAQAIFEQHDAVAVGCELLNGANSERGANASNSVKARIWETLVDFMFGKQPPAASANASASSQAPNLHIVWDIPAPPHEQRRNVEPPRAETHKR